MINRRNLYDEIWSIPFTHLCEKYGLTYIELKKLCKELNIPRPNAGYWSKIRAGKIVPKIDLPNSDIMEFVIEDYLPRKRLKKTTEKVNRAIPVKKKMGSLHPLVKRTYDSLLNSYGTREGKLRARSSSTLDVAVTKKHLKRAIRILDAIVAEFDRLNLEIHTTTYNRVSKSYVKIGEEEVYFHLHEKGKRVKKENPKYSWDSYDHVNTGELVLGLSDSKFWHRTRSISDGKTEIIEDKLDRFFGKVFTIADELKKERLEHRKRADAAAKEKARIEALQAKKRELKEVREKRAQQEAEKFKELKAQAHSLKESQLILELIESVESNFFKANPNEIEISRFREWKTWAMEQANKVNPVHQLLNRFVILP